MPSAVFIALTRAVPPTLAACELTYLPRQPIDLTTAIEQHRRYEDELRALGCRVERVEPAPELPDSVFIEDTAVVLPEVAVLGRPGAASRRDEVEPVATALSAYVPVARLAAPATLDGGDVLVAGRRVFVGLSTRTSPDAAAQLAAILQPHGYTVETVRLERCLHLKSAATAIADDLLIVNPALVDPDAFAGLRTLDVDPGEPEAANILRIGDTLIAPESAPRTRRQLEDAGLTVHVVDTSELAKAEGSLTCCCLIVEERSTPA
jgi:dimethylargininase